MRQGFDWGVAAGVLLLAVLLAATAAGFGAAPAALGLAAVGVSAWAFRRGAGEGGRVADGRRELLRTTLASIGDAVIVTDPGRRVMFMNPEAERLTGWARAEADGRDLDEVFPILSEETRERVPCPVARVLATGRVVGLANHTVLVARDGTERPIDDSAAPVRGEGGEVHGVVLVFRDISEKHAAAEQVRASEGLLRLITDAAPALISYVGPDRRYRLVNRGYETWFGHPREEVVGRTMAEVLGEAAWGAVGPWLGRALAGEAVTYESEVAYKDGGTRWISATYTPDRDPAGGVRGVVVLVTDVTDRRRAEGAVRESEARLRFVLENMPILLDAFDEAGTPVVWNRECERVTGYPAAEVVGNPRAMDLLYPDGGYRGRMLAEWAGRGDDYRDWEWEATARDGTRRTIAWSNVSGRLPVPGWASWGIGVDVTARRAAEEKLRESERRFHEFADTAPAMLWVTGPDGACSFLSRGWYEFTGQTEDKGLGFGWLDAVHPGDRPGAERAFLAANERKEAFALEHRLRRADGTYRWVIDAGRPRFSPAGEFLGYVGSVTDIDDRRRGEDALRASEERFRTLVTTTSAVVWTTDGTGAIVEDNPSWRAFTGQTRAECAGFGWLAAVHPEDRDRVARVWADAVRGGRRYDTEYRLRRRDGGYRVVVVRGAPVAGPGGAVREWVGDCADVTDERAAEAEARRADARAAAILEGIGEGFVVLDADWRFVYVNPAFERMNGVGREDVLGRNHWEVYPATIGTRLEAEYRRVAATGETAEFENHYEPWDRWFAVKAYPAPGGGLNVQFRDVTAARRAEEQLRRSHDTFLSLIENAPFGVYLVDADFRLRQASAGAQKAFQNVRPLLGRDFAEVMRILWPEPAAGGFIARFRHTLATGDPYHSAETTERRNDVPETESYDWKIERVTLPDGRFGVVCYFYDTTAVRRAEAELREADRRKDEFLALLAHELRNPLAPIRTGLEVVRRSADPAARDRALGVMDRHLGHMVRLIDDLLNVSRIGRGRLELRRARVALSEAVADAVETARPAIDAAGHELAVDLPGDPVFLDADLTRLAQVFGNLLTNSAKYTPPGGRIHLSARREGGEVVVTVRDTGVGIPAESLSAIFDMFSQVDRGTDRSAGGLGIGLALVKGLTEMHGGTVAAASDGPGRGSTFTVRLPAAADRPDPAPPPAVPGPARRRRILVVDDNRDAAESMAEMLAMFGNEVATAHDGVEAVERAGEFRPEVILMDLGMPRLDGLGATRRIREQAWGRGVTVIALTGWGQEADRARTREAGCDGHLVKPVDLSDLEKVLAAARDG